MDLNKPMTQIISEAPVQVCPICDIEGCRHIREVASQPVQPLTVHDAARVPEIAALIEKAEALRDDVTGRVDAFGECIGTAQPMIGFGAKQWADFIAALRAIAEGRA